MLLLSASRPAPSMSEHWPRNTRGMNGTGKVRDKLDSADHLTQHSLLHFSHWLLSSAFFLCISSSNSAFLIILIGCTCSSQSLLCATQIGKWEMDFVLDATPTLRTWVLNWGLSFPCHYSPSSRPPHSPTFSTATQERGPFLPWTWHRAVHTVICLCWAEHLNSGSWKSELLFPHISWQGSVNILRIGQKPKD